MTGRIDVHCHLLPDVDDGCPASEDSIDCARRLAAVGYTHIFCTPHIWPTLPANHAANIARQVEWLQGELRQAHVDVTLLPGGEIDLETMWPLLAGMKPEEIPTFGNARRYCLCDFWSEILPPDFESAVRHLQALGLKVILAHPERIYPFQDDPGLWDYVAGLGILLQGNLGCFRDPPDSPTRELIEQKARAGAYWLLGTDCHWPESLDDRLDGLLIAMDILGEETVDRLTRHNPRQLLPR